MAQSYYPQSDAPGRTITVGDLIARLQAFDPASPVIFRSPFNGAFGPLQAYSIDGASHTVLPAEEMHHPAGRRVDEETGETYIEGAWTQSWPGWEGVVIE